PSPSRRPGRRTPPLPRSLPRRTGRAAFGPTPRRGSTAPTQTTGRPRSGRARPDGRYPPPGPVGGGPQPPPPGVRTVTTDPGSSSRLALGGSGRPSTSLAPGLPGPPPAAPAGAWRRRSVSRETVAGASTRIERTRPAPPAWRPAPAV